jgi:hypothetical protein
MSKFDRGIAGTFGLSKCLEKRLIPNSVEFSCYGFETDISHWVVLWATDVLPMECVKARGNW